MSPIISLPPGVAIAVIAFLLSLLPAGLFIWLWYLRRTDRPLAPGTVAAVFLGGIILVGPAWYLERFAAETWATISPQSAHNFAGAVLPLQSALDVLLPAIGTFLIVATIEEGLRYLFLRWWISRSASVDQVFDGLVLGVAAGLGFATLENTLYFLDLFREGNLDTLVLVFFLRFIVSTLAHLSFGGLMGTLIARGVFSMYNPGRYLRQAFFVTWFVHGAFDLMLSVNLSTYAILLLVPALMSLIAWSHRRDFFIINRKNGRLLVFEEPPQTRRTEIMRHFLKQFESRWNKNAPWLSERRRYSLLFKELTQHE